MSWPRLEWHPAPCSGDAKGIKHKGTGYGWSSAAVRADGIEPIGEGIVESVNHPEHYTRGDVECIDAIRSALGADGFRSYCLGNVIKYVWRHRHKGGKEDLSKALWYMEQGSRV